MSAPIPAPKPEDYLGDGVYATHDGYHVVLDLRAQPEGGHVCRIGLDPYVLAALDRFRTRAEAQWTAYVKARNAATEESQGGDPCTN